MSISKFKATCLSVLARVKKTGQPVLITKHGKPVAEVVPPRPVPSAQSWIGSAAGVITIHGDIVAPVSDVDDWEALEQ